MWTKTASLLFLLLWLSPGNAAEDKPACAPSADAEQYLQTKYGESPVMAGVTGGGILYITANPQTGSFTVLIRDNGISCLITAGKGFAAMAPEKPGDDL